MNGIACIRGSPGTAGRAVNSHSYQVNILHQLTFLELTITMTAWEKSREIKNPGLGETKKFTLHRSPGISLETCGGCCLEVSPCVLSSRQLQKNLQLWDLTIGSVVSGSSP